MEHSDAQPLLVDAAFDRLVPTTAAAVWQHAGACGDCLDHIVAALAVRSALHSERGADANSGQREAPGPHVASDALAAWSLGQPSGDPAEMLASAQHLASCRSCRREVSLLREADRSSRPRDVFESWLGRLRLPALGWPAAGIATAAAVAVFAWPAYLSLVELPRVRGELEASRHALERSKDDAVAEARVSPEAASGGASATRLLVLRDPLRGSDDLPSVPQAVPGTSRPIVLSYPFDNWLREDPDARCVVTVTRAGGADVVRLELPVRELWDARSAAGVLVVPGNLLTPGRYRLAVAPAQGGPARMSVEFEITPNP